MTGNGGNRLDRIEKLLEQTVRANKEGHARFDADLRKWVKGGVKEALSQRKRMRIIDEKITQLAAAQLITEEKLEHLAAAQLVTEEKLQRFISSAGRGRNGH